MADPSCFLPGIGGVDPAAIVAAIERADADPSTNPYGRVPPAAGDGPPCTVGIWTGREPRAPDGAPPWSPQVEFAVDPDERSGSFNRDGRVIDLVPPDSIVFRDRLPWTVAIVRPWAKGVDGRGYWLDLATMRVVVADVCVCDRSDTEPQRTQELRRSRRVDKWLRSFIVSFIAPLPPPPPPGPDGPEAPIVRAAVRGDVALVIRLLDEGAGILVAGIPPRALTCMEQIDHPRASAMAWAWSRALDRPYRDPPADLRDPDRVALLGLAERVWANDKPWALDAIFALSGGGGVNAGIG